MKHFLSYYDRAMHVSDSFRDDGPFCWRCQYGDTRLWLDRGLYWCDNCLSDVEEYEHRLESTR